jgi:hypothetical protein
VEHGARNKLKQLENGLDSWPLYFSILSIERFTNSKIRMSIAATSAGEASGPLLQAVRDAS